MNLRSGFTKHEDGVLCRNCNEYYGAKQFSQKCSYCFNKRNSTTIHPWETQVFRKKVNDWCKNKYIDKIYFCPHLETSNCDCRKPRLGMFRKAQLDFPKINIDRSFLVGDSDSDILAGKGFGLETVKVSTSFTLYDWLIELSK